MLCGNLGTVGIDTILLFIQVLFKILQIKNVNKLLQTNKHAASLLIKVSSAPHCQCFNLMPEQTGPASPAQWRCSASTIKLKSEKVCDHWWAFPLVASFWLLIGWARVTPDWSNFDIKYLSPLASKSKSEKGMWLLESFPSSPFQLVKKLK